MSRKKQDEINAAVWNWGMMQINATVYARGTARHPNHKTIVLYGWHRIFMNTEAEAPGARNVFFWTE